MTKPVTNTKALHALSPQSPHIKKNVQTTLGYFPLGPFSKQFSAEFQPPSSMVSALAVKAPTRVVLSCFPIGVFSADFSAPFQPTSMMAAVRFGGGQTKVLGVLSGMAFSRRALISAVRTVASANAATKTISTPRTYRTSGANLAALIRASPRRLSTTAANAVARVLNAAKSLPASSGNAAARLVGIPRTLAVASANASARLLIASRLLRTSAAGNATSSRAVSFAREFDANNASGASRTLAAGKLTGAPSANVATKAISGARAFSISNAAVAAKALTGGISQRIGSGSRPAVVRSTREAFSLTSGESVDESSGVIKALRSSSNSVARRVLAIARAFGIGGPPAMTSLNATGVGRALKVASGSILGYTVAVAKSIALASGSVAIRSIGWTQSPGASEDNQALLQMLTPQANPTPSVAQGSATGQVLGVSSAFTSNVTQALDFIDVVFKPITLASTWSSAVAEMAGYVRTFGVGSTSTRSLASRFIQPVIASAIDGITAEQTVSLTRALRGSVSSVAAFVARAGKLLALASASRAARGTPLSKALSATAALIEAHHVDVAIDLDPPQAQSAEAGLMVGYLRTLSLSQTGVISRFSDVGKSFAAASVQAFRVARHVGAGVRTAGTMAASYIVTVSAVLGYAYNPFDPIFSLVFGAPSMAGYVAFLAARSLLAASTNRANSGFSNVVVREKSVSASQTNVARRLAGVSSGLTAAIGQMARQGAGIARKLAAGSGMAASYVVTPGKVLAWVPSPWSLLFTQDFGGFASAMSARMTIGQPTGATLFLFASQASATAFAASASKLIGIAQRQKARIVRWFHRFIPGPQRDRIVRLPPTQTLANLPASVRRVRLPREEDEMSGFQITRAEPTNFSAFDPTDQDSFTFDWSIRGYGNDPIVFANVSSIPLGVNFVGPAFIDGSLVQVTIGAFTPPQVPMIYLLRCQAVFASGRISYFSVPFEVRSL